MNRDAGREEQQLLLTTEHMREKRRKGTIQPDSLFAELQKERWVG